MTKHKKVAKVPKKPVKRPAFGPATAQITSLAAQYDSGAVALQVDSRMSLAHTTAAYTFNLVMTSTASDGSLTTEGQTCITILPSGVFVSAPISLQVLQNQPDADTYRLIAKVIGQDAQGSLEELAEREINYTIP